MKPGRFGFVLIVLVTVLSEPIGELSKTESIKASGEGATVRLGLSDVSEPKQPPATQLLSANVSTLANPSDTTDTNEDSEERSLAEYPAARHHRRSWLSELFSGFFPTLGVVVCFFAICRCRAERQRREMMLEAQQPAQQMAVSETVLQAQINFHREEARRIEQQLQLQHRPYIYAFGQPGQAASAPMDPVYSK